MGIYFRFYNDLKPHQALGYWTLAEVFHGVMNMNATEQES